MKCGLRFGAGTRGAGTLGTGTLGTGTLGADWRPDRYQIAGHQIAMAKLPAEGTQARRFGKTRSEQATALLEDYAELIADLLAGEGEARPADIARRFGVSHATAIKTVSRLKRAGLATARPYRGVFLTEKGHALAEGIEHHVSEITLKAFAQFLKARG